MSGTFRGDSLRHGLGNGTHAADRMAPLALVSIHLAEAMMQQYIGGAWRIRAGIIADDRIEAEDGFERIAFEPSVEIVAGGSREDFQDVTLAFETRMAQAVAESAELDELAECCERMRIDDIRRRLEHERPQEIGERGKPQLVGREPLGVAAREFRHFSLRPTGPDLQIAAVVERQKVSELAAR